jgi:SpoIIAA-like
MTAAAHHVELSELPSGRGLEIHLTGTLTREDYQLFLPRVEALIRQHGKARLLVQMHDFHGWTAGALWDDIKFDARHFNHFERLAIVGEKRWEQAMATFCRPFTTAQVRYFDASEAEQARRWVDEV